MSLGLCKSATTLSAYHILNSLAYVKGIVDLQLILAAPNRVTDRCLIGFLFFLSLPNQLLPSPC